jgi:hypothetical protein
VTVKYTKQGVRDLGGNGRRSKRPRRELPPDIKRALCDHPLSDRAESDYRIKCLACGEVWLVADYYVPWYYG